MPSHTDTNPAKKKKAPSRMQEWHVKGNNQADQGADKGAAIHAIPEDNTKPVLDKFKSLMLIQSRIIRAIKQYPQREYNKKPLKENPTHLQKVEEAVRLSKHSLVLDGSRVCCLNCKASVPIKASHVFDFIGSACLIEEEYMSYAIGNLHTHPSHQVVLYGGVLFCKQCGSTGVNKAINLNRPCTPARQDLSQYGLDNIKRYDASKLPSGFPAWPYNKVKLAQKVFLKTWQTKLDLLQAKQSKLAQEPEPSESWPSDNSDSVSIHSSLSSGDTNADEHVA